MKIVVETLNEKIQVLNKQIKFYNESHDTLLIERESKTKELEYIDEQVRNFESMINKLSNEIHILNESIKVIKSNMGETLKAIEC